MLILVKADDWQGLYVNNRLWEEDYIIEISTIKKACKRFGISIDNLEELWVTDNYYNNVLSEVGNYPDNFEDVEVQ